ncbi:hypothetical protein GCM10009850_074030 [Nonomuraea monospora]|uniref:Transcriptional regulator n=2 Tax=Nonomuraea monospora TaxID=568818 RepID=A0ABP5PK16_9ACTN
MLEVALGIVLGLAGITVSVLLGRGQAREARRRKSIDRFMRTRRWLKTNEKLLAPVAARRHPDLPGADPNVPGFYRPEWLLEKPIPLDGVTFALLPEPPEPPPHLDAMKRLWPFDSTGRRLDSYSEAVTAHDRPAHWFNGTSYRLLDVTRTDAGHLRLSVCLMRYLNGFDSWGGLLHEAAERYRKTSGRDVGGPYRRRLGDPFDLRARHCAIGFSVLTVRRAPGGSTFFLHRRNECVASGNNVTSLIPAGEFQPSDDSRLAAGADLDLWRAMTREYAEELLGMEEARFRTGAPLDYAGESPFKELGQAYRRGAVRAYLLDVRLHPVSWKASLRIVCVFNARTFDRIFSGMVAKNAEGMLELPSPRRRATGSFQGWPLDEETVARCLADVTLVEGGRTCIARAWQHRHALGLVPSPSPTRRS